LIKFYNFDTTLVLRKSNLAFKFKFNVTAQLISNFLKVKWVETNISKFILFIEPSVGKYYYKHVVDDDILYAYR
jgi:hypothetical protein